MSNKNRTQLNGKDEILGKIFHTIYLEVKIGMKIQETQTKFKKHKRTGGQESVGHRRDLYGSGKRRR